MTRRRSRAIRNGPKMPTTTSMKTGCLGLKTSTWLGSAQTTKRHMQPKVRRCAFLSFTPWDQSFARALADLRSTDALDKTKVTGISQVDNLQDGVNNLVGGQVGKDGLLAPVGNAVSKEGINRAERGGKDEKGTYGGPAASVTDPLAKNAQSAGQGLVGGAQSAGGAAADGAKGVGGYVSGMFGGGGKKTES